MKLDFTTLGLGAAAAYLLFKQSAPAAAPAPAQTPAQEAAATIDQLLAALQAGADQAASGGATSTSPASPGYVLASAETAAAQTKDSCQNAGGYWVPGDMFGLSKTNGVCADPQRSSAACKGTGGDWTGAECRYPNQTLMGYGDQSVVWPPGLVIAAGALAFAWYAYRH